MARSKPDRPRVFCIGWHKTGTSSLGMALLELGYSVLGCRLDMAEPLLRKDLDKPLELAGDFDALQDVPWAALYKELDAKYPGSKFILTLRDQHSWLESASRHFIDYDVGLHRWLYGAGVMKGNEELYIERYNKHYGDVEKYFNNRPNDLLVMNLTEGDGWEKLCGFLEEPIPLKSFPYANKGKYKYNWKELLKLKLREAVPMWMRRVRVIALHKFGFHQGRNQFNNAAQNEEWQSKIKRN